LSIANLKFKGDPLLVTLSQRPAFSLAAAAAAADFCRAGPMAVLDSINSTLASMNADVDTLLSMASREQLLPIYSEAKSLVCCMVPDVAASMWMGLTFAGEHWYCTK
jgi:hypothetical protein